VAVAAVTVALAAPNNTILLAGVVLKLAPLIVTDVPAGPDAGENELITGCAAVTIDNIRPVSINRLLRK
jgi:hypothetical protein